MGFYVQIREVMYKYYDQMLSGDVSVEEGFDRIEEEANQLLDRFHDTYSG
jgi:sn-glycerol 3-phosphate transport system substrate-binding protein